jgi:hypothetical protein
MEGILLGAGAVAVLVGLGALVEAARPRHGGAKGNRVSPGLRRVEKACTPSC